MYVKDGDAMQLKNTSQYPTDEVRRLVEFGMQGINTARLQVNVKNCCGAYRGRAYESVPRISPSSAKSTVDRLVTIGIGNDSNFPVDNVREVTKPVTPWMLKGSYDFDALLVDLVAKGHNTGMISWSHRFERDGSEYVRGYEVVRQPYGGKRSPVIVVNNWREAMVVLAAHEGCHIYQYQHNKPRSEVKCEQFAAKALERYRASRR